MSFRSYLPLKIKKHLFIALAAALGFLPVQASAAFFQASLVPGVALHPEKEQINGLVLNVAGENPQNALALGIANISPGKSSGVSLALLFNIAENYTGLRAGMLNFGGVTGVQMGGLNFFGSINGIQFGVMNASIGFGMGGGDRGGVVGGQLGLINLTGKLSGAQLGFLNQTNGTMSGVQLGVVNRSGDGVSGVQLGVLNYSRGKVSGLQLGVVNWAADLHGVQVGLFNRVTATSGFGDFPQRLAQNFVLVNWAF